MPSNLNQLFSQISFYKLNSKFNLLIFTACTCHIFTSHLPASLSVNRKWRSIAAVYNSREKIGFKAALFSIFFNFNNGSNDYVYCERGSSAVPLCSTELRSIFQLIVLVLQPCSFTALVHSHRSHQLCFQARQVAVFSQKALINPQHTTYTPTHLNSNRHLANHSGAVGILDLHSLGGQKHNSKYMLMLFCVWWMCK